LRSITVAKNTNDEEAINDDEAEMQFVDDNNLTLGKNSDRGN